MCVCMYVYVCVAASTGLCELAAVQCGALSHDGVQELCRSLPVLLPRHDPHHHQRTLHRSGTYTYTHIHTFIDT